MKLNNKDREIKGDRNYRVSYKNKYLFAYGRTRHKTVYVTAYDGKTTVADALRDFDEVWNETDYQGSPTSYKVLRVRRDKRTVYDT